MPIPDEYLFVGDTIADHVVKKYTNLPPRLRSQDNEWTVLAGFVAVYSNEYYASTTTALTIPSLARTQSSSSPTCELISMATGSRCLGKSLLSRWGEVVSDMHAEILAHRILTCVFYQDIKELHTFCREITENRGKLIEKYPSLFSSETTGTVTINSKFFQAQLSTLSAQPESNRTPATTQHTHTPFEPSSICPSLLRVSPRRGLSWHLYISDPPCGVAAVDLPAHIDFARYIEDNQGKYSINGDGDEITRDIREEDVSAWLNRRVARDDKKYQVCGCFQERNNMNPTRDADVHIVCDATTNKAGHMLKSEVASSVDATFSPSIRANSRMNAAFVRSTGAKSLAWALEDDQGSKTTSSDAIQGSEVVNDASVASCDGPCLTQPRVKAGRSDLPPALRSLSLSCSDKVAKWGHVGLQTSLLSHFLLSPIPLASVTIGADAAHCNPLSLYRALIGRFIDVKTDVETRVTRKSGAADSSLPQDSNVGVKSAMCDHYNTEESPTRSPKSENPSLLGISGCAMRYRSSARARNTHSSHSHTISPHSTQLTRTGQWVIRNESLLADDEGCAALPPPLLFVSGDTFPWAKHVQLARINNFPLPNTQINPENDVHKPISSGNMNISGESISDASMLNSDAALDQARQAKEILQPQSSGFSTCWSYIDVLPMAVTADSAKSHRSTGKLPATTGEGHELSSNNGNAVNHEDQNRNFSWASCPAGFADVLTGKIGLRQGSKRRDRDVWDTLDDTATGDADSDMQVNRDKSVCGDVSEARVAKRRESGSDTALGVCKRQCVQSSIDAEVNGGQTRISIAHQGSATQMHMHPDACNDAVKEATVSDRGNETQMGDLEVVFDGKSWYAVVLKQMLSELRSKKTQEGQLDSGSSMTPVFPTSRSAAVTAPVETKSEDKESVLGIIDSDSMSQARKKKDKKKRGKGDRKRENPNASSLLPSWMVDCAGASKVSRLRMARLYADVLVNACCVPRNSNNTSGGGVLNETNTSQDPGSGDFCECDCLICPLRIQEAHQKAVLSREHDKAECLRDVTSLASAEVIPKPSRADTPLIDDLWTSSMLRVITLREAKLAGWHKTWSKRVMPKYQTFKKPSLQDMPLLLSLWKKNRHLPINHTLCERAEKNHLELASLHRDEIFELFKLYINPKY